MSNLNKINSAIANLFEEDIIADELICPFCGAGEEFIETYDIDYEEIVVGDDDDDDEEDYDDDEEDYDDDEEDYEIVEPSPEIEFHCIKCDTWWIYDEDNDYYEIEYDEYEHREEQNLTGYPSISIKSFKKFYDKTSGKTVAFMPAAIDINESKDELSERVKGKRARKRSRRKTKPRARRANIKKARMQKRKDTQRKRLNKRVGRSKTKKVAWRKGKYVVVKKDFRGRVRKKRKNEELLGLRLYKVKILDEALNLNGWLIKLVESSNNVSNFEQLCSKYLKQADKPIFEDFIEMIKDKFKTEYEQLQIIKEAEMNKFSKINEATNKDDITGIFRSFSEIFKKYDKSSSDLHSNFNDSLQALSPKDLKSLNDMLKKVVNGLK